MTLGFNQRAAIAADLEELKKDPDIPVYIDGDLWNGVDCVSMDDGEAARIVVDVIIDHPFVQAALEERDRYWEALKWLSMAVELTDNVPDELLSTILGAAEAAMFEASDSHTILGDE